MGREERKREEFLQLLIERCPLIGFKKFRDKLLASFKSLVIRLPLEQLISLFLLRVALLCAAYREARNLTGLKVDDEIAEGRRKRERKKKREKEKRLPLKR